MTVVALFSSSSSLITKKLMSTIFSLLLLSVVIVVVSNFVIAIRAYECSMKVAFNFTISARKMIDVRTTEHVHREDELFCGYSFQKLFAILDNNATDYIYASAASPSSSPEDPTSAIGTNKNNIIIDNLRVTKYEFLGKRADVGGRKVHYEMYDQIEKDTRKRFTAPFLDEILEKQDTATDVGRRDKYVVDVDVTPDKPALYFMTSATSGNFFTCGYVMDGWDFSSTREYELTVEFTSNVPCGDGGVANRKKKGEEKEKREKEEAAAASSKKSTEQIDDDDF